MSYGLYDYSRRRRRRAWIQFTYVLLALGVVGAIAGFSYQLGIEQLKNREITLTKEIESLTNAKTLAEQQAAQYQERARTAEVKVEELSVRYERDVPSGELGKLKDLVARKLAEGVDPGRLSFIIDQTGTPRNCGIQETKRFVLATPIYRGANTSITFGEGAVTVAGEGVSFRNASGSPEAWFDPTKPVIMRFILADGSTTQMSGVLPIDNAVIANDREYRFKISAGARSFVEVLGSSCPFP